MGYRTNTAIWEPKHNRWRIRVQKNGERRAFYSPIPGRTGQRECNAKADAWLDEGLQNPETKAFKIFDAWLEELKATCAYTKWYNIDVHWRNWIKPVIGNMKIGDVTEHHYQTVIYKAFAAGRAKKYLENIRGTISLFNKHCRKCKATNLVIEGLEIPKGAPEGERTILQPDDITILMTSDKTLFKGKEISEPFINGYRFEVTTGLRPGEVAGMKWADIEDDRIVHLSRSINFQNTKTKGKSDNAIRSFVLKPIDIEILQKQREYLLATGIRSEYVFPDTDGGHLRQSKSYKHWVKYRDYNGIAKASPYELRHTFVSMVKDMPEGLLKPLVGHSVDMDTYKTYSHQVTGDMERTADIAQSIFSEILKKDDNKRDTGTA